jgi:hypothetical protein
MARIQAGWEGEGKKKQRKPFFTGKGKAYDVFRINWNKTKKTC